MRLATSQRPHAPPVPPRPSKQVVAEALKKSTRLPCPTRQAPPPPNTRPWRLSDDTKTSNKNISINNDKTSINEAKKDFLKNSLVSPNDTDRSSSNKIVQKSDNMQESINKHKKSFLEETQRKIQNFKNPSGINNYENFTINNQNTNNIVDDVNSNVNVKNDDQQVKKNEIIQNNLLNKTESTHHDLLKQSTELNSTSPSTQSMDSQSNKTTVLVTINKNDLNIPINANRMSTSPNLRQSTTVSNNEDCTTVVVIDRTDDNVTINNDKDDNKENIQKQDWLEEGIHYSSTKITLGSDEINANSFNKQLENRQHGYLYNKNQNQSDPNPPSICEKIAMASLQGLPPLPRSLSGLYLNEGLRENNEPPPPPTRSSSKMTKIGINVPQSNSRRSSPGRQFITLDTQLTILKKEMYGLRQLDLSILSQLWSLNESIQEYRQLLQEHEERAPSPSPSSEEGDDLTYNNHPAASSRRTSSLHHHHHHHHYHHRPPRPPRPLRPLPSDESPSSEEYGAV